MNDDPVTGAVLTYLARMTAVEALDHYGLARTDHNVKRLSTAILTVVAAWLADDFSDPGIMEDLDR